MNVQTKRSAAAQGKTDASRLAALHQDRGGPADQLGGGEEVDLHDLAQDRLGLRAVLTALASHATALLTAEGHAKIAHEPTIHPDEAAM